MNKFFLKNSTTMLAIFVLFVAVAGFFFNYLNVAAQSQEGGWSEPVNLSRSGGTSNPFIVYDSDGLLHAIWQDAYNGFIYSSFDGQGWSTPTPVEFPFSEDLNVNISDFHPPLQLLADGVGNIYAFWLDQDGNLSYSKVSGSNFEIPSAWLAPKTLSDVVVKFDVSVDPANILHLGYIRNEDTEAGPAGLYYRRSTNEGGDWFKAQNIYISPYFRELTIRDAHLDVASTGFGDQNKIFIGWDNPLLKRVYLSTSIDSGENWTDPEEVYGPGADTIDPFNILVQPNGDQVLLLWEAGLQSGFDCTQYYQVSRDGGLSWNDRQTILDELVGCPQESQVFSSPNGLTFLVTTIQDSVYIIAWDGEKWSNPQRQDELTGFVNPDTLGPVTLGCRNSLLSPGDILQVAGCNQAGEKDIWFVTRSLAVTGDWFPAPDDWVGPTQIITNTTGIASVNVVVDFENILNTFVIDSTSTDDQVSIDSLSNTTYSNNQWNDTIQILAPPDGEANNLNVINHPKDRILAAWTMGNIGSGYISWVNASEADIASKWSKSIDIPSPKPFMNSPKLAALGSKVVAAYSIPLNEERGIYLTSSDDFGQTWSEQTIVFDGVEAGWEAVGPPDITASSDGTIYFLWSHQPLPGDDKAPQALYFSSSTDEGDTFTTPSLVVEEPTPWYKIIADAGENIHRFWTTGTGDRSQLWAQYSNDGGNTWSIPINLAKFGDVIGPANAFLDPGGVVHLIWVVQNSDRLELRHSIFMNGVWSQEEAASLGKYDLSEVKSISGGISGDGILGVTYILGVNRNNDSEETYQLFGLTKPYPVQAVTPAAPAGTVTPEITSLATPEPTFSEPVQQPELQFSPTPIQLNTTAPPSRNWIGLIAGGLLAAIIVVVSFVLALRGIRSK